MAASCHSEGIFYVILEAVVSVCALNIRTLYVEDLSDPWVLLWGMVNICSCVRSLDRRSLPNLSFLFWRCDLLSPLLKP